MYARLKSGVLEEFVGESLSYTKTENGTMYYIRIINPTEKEFGEAGYFKVSDTSAAALCMSVRKVV